MFISLPPYCAGIDRRVLCRHGLTPIAPCPGFLVAIRALVVAAGVVPRYWWSTCCWMPSWAHAIPVDLRPPWGPCYSGRSPATVGPGREPTTVLVMHLYEDDRPGVVRTTTGSETGVAKPAL